MSSLLCMSGAKMVSSNAFDHPKGQAIITRYYESQAAAHYCSEYIFCNRDNHQFDFSDFPPFSKKLFPADVEAESAGA